MLCSGYGAASGGSNGAGPHLNGESITFSVYKYVIDRLLFTVAFHFKEGNLRMVEAWGQKVNQQQGALTMSKLPRKIRCIIFLKGVGQSLGPQGGYTGYPTKGVGQ